MFATSLFVNPSSTILKLIGLPSCDTTRIWFSFSTNNFKSLWSPIFKPLSKKLIKFSKVTLSPLKNSDAWINDPSIIKPNEELLVPQ